MQWLSLIAQGAPASVTPVDQATESLVSYIVSFGTLGVFALLAGWLLLRGWRLVSPAELTAIREAARAEARTDLIAERDRVLEDRRKAEAERDEALKAAQEKLVPLLQNFVATTSTLVPLLQDIVLGREPPRRRRGPDP